MIKDSGNRRNFETGAVRDMAEGKGDMVSLPANAILRLSKHYENGAKKYGRWNYQKGIPVSSFIDSALRHLFKYLAGYDDEPHLDAAAFNILGAMEMEEKHPELQDLPIWKEKAIGMMINCAETTCYYNNNGICECDNADNNPFEGKNCKWYSED